MRIKAIKVLVRKKDNTWADITKAIPQGNLTILQLTTERVFGDFSASDITLKTINSLWDFNQFYNGQEVEIHAQKEDGSWFPDPVFRGWVDITTLRVDKCFAEITIYSTIKKAENMLVSDVCQTFSGLADDLAWLLIDKLGIRWVEVNIPDIELGSGQKDWNLSLKDFSKGKLDFSEICLYPERRPLSQGREAIGIMAIGGQVYEVIRHPRCQVELSLIPQEILPIMNCGRIFRAPISNDGMCQYYFFISQDGKNLDFIRAFWLKDDWSWELASDLPDLPWGDRDNRNVFPKDSVFVLQNVSIGNIPLASVWIVKTGGTTGKTVLYRLVWIEEEGRYNWDDYKDLGMAMPEGGTAVYHKPYGVGGYIFFAVGTSEGWKVSEWAYENGVYLTRIQTYNLPLTKYPAIIGHGDDADDPCFLLLPGRKYLKMTRTGNSLKEYPLSQRGNQLEMISAYPQFPHTGETRGWMKEIRTEGEEIYPFIITYNRYGLSSGQFARGVDFAFPDILDEDPVPPISFWDANQRTRIFIVPVVSANSLDIWQTSKWLCPLVHDNFAESKTTIREALSQIAQTFYCFLKLVEYGNVPAGIFSRIFFSPPLASHLTGANIIEPTIEEVKLIDRIEIEAYGTKIKVGKGMKNILRISNKYLTPAWARFIAQKIYERYKDGRKFIVLKSQDIEYITKLLCKVYADVFGKNHSYLITNLSFSRQDNLCVLGLEEYVDEPAIVKLSPYPFYQPEPSDQPPNSFWEIDEEGNLTTKETNWLGHIGWWETIEGGLAPALSQEGEDMFWKEDPDGNLMPKEA